MMAFHVFTEDKISLAIDNDRLSQMDEYLQLGLDVNYVFCEKPNSPTYSLSLVHYAVVRNAWNIVKLLISRGCDVNKATEIIRQKSGKTEIKVKTK